MDQEKSGTSIGEQVKAYVETKVEIIRLTSIQKGARIMAGAATRMVLFQLVLFTIFFGGFAAASWIKKETGNEILGYAVVCLFFLLVAAIYMLFRGGVNRRLEDRFISKMTSDDEDQ
jgi:hypothetical protein